MNCVNVSPIEGKTYGTMKTVLFSVHCRPDSSPQLIIATSFMQGACKGITGKKPWPSCELSTSWYRLKNVT
jgi:hypothetical protein